ncbi:Arm DNA-binding domain-containing protein [Dysgonomonas termitidis]|uniref:Arm DNA-binding domain-containing protein n=1 Tax=Dysgonomonas termitidis TaxID=1516126 RepID=A0ABV9L0M6_9BACT
MKPELKGLFYLKKNQRNKGGLCPVMGYIRIGKSVSQFSLKIDADTNLWDTKAGRVKGKSHQALEINRVIHTRYKELSEINSQVDADDLKNAVQGIASIQPTVLDSFRTMNDAISARVGKDYSKAGFEQ